MQFKYEHEWLAGNKTEGGGHNLFQSTVQREMEENHKNLT
jgi:hypothetical protein